MRASGCTAATAAPGWTVSGSSASRSPISACRCSFPRYRLRNAAITGWCDLAPANGLQQATGPIRRGDVLLTQPGPAQHHLLVALGADRFVHAHAGLGRVVIQPQPYREPPLAQWRLALEQEFLWPR